MPTPIEDIICGFTRPEMFTFLCARGYKVEIQMRNYKDALNKIKPRQICIIYKDGKELKSKNDKDFQTKNTLLNKIMEKELRNIVLETNVNYRSNEK